MDPFAYLGSLGMFRMRPGLSRIRMLSRELGSPEASIPSVLVAGTNGKGSTCYMTGAIMEAIGLRTLVYTSPHMLSPTERFLVNGTEVSQDILGRSIEKVRSIAQGIPEEEDRPTYFEVLTASAFDIAREEKVDCIIAEVGLGGRFDATNILTPSACAITSISLDHTEILGEDVRSISSEKAGIIKASTPLVLGPLEGAGEEADKIRRNIIGICSQNGSPVIAVQETGEDTYTDLLEGSDVPDWRMVMVSSSTGRDGTTGEFTVERPEDPIQRIPLLSLLDDLVPGKYSTPLPGRHQANNMASALCLSSVLLPYAISMKNIRKGAHEYLSNMLDADPRPIIGSFGMDRIKEGMHQGLGSVRVKDRFEIVDLNGRTLILDGGHNEESGERIARTFSELFPGSKAHILIAMSGEKDHIAFLSHLSGIVASMTVTVANAERGMLPFRIVGAASSSGGSYPIKVREDPFQAVEEWIGSIRPGEIGLACGTFYLYSHLDKGRAEWTED
jgi:folylpolyglutamate synthase/dihydropteroate synthase